MDTHYNTLGVKETATQEEIKKSYKNLSKKYHPDRPEGDEKKFKEINKAYEELSDPEKRRQYDLSFRGNINNSTSYGHHSSSRAFEQFFGARFRSSPKTKPRNRDINHTLKVTLKEIYTGVTKKFRVKRHRVRPGTNEVYLEDKLLSVQIPPGISSGRSVMIKGEGNQYPGETFPGEILLKIIETNDTPFKRCGQNLIYPIKLNLKSALTGSQLNIDHLDGHKLKVPITDIIRPGMERIIQGEGLPFYNNISKKGSLIIRFEVEFPMSLDAEVKQQLKQLL